MEALRLKTEIRSVGTLFKSQYEMIFGTEIRDMNYSTGSRQHCDFIRVKGRVRWPPMGYL